MLKILYIENEMLSGLEWNLQGLVQIGYGRMFLYKDLMHTNQNLRNK